MGDEFGECWGWRSGYSTPENRATVEDILSQLGATPSVPGRSAVHWSAGCWTVRDCRKSVTTRSVLCLRFVCWAITHHTTEKRRA